MSDGGGDAGAFDIEGGGTRDVGDTCTEVTSENLGERLKSSCSGICLGLLLFFGAFPLLFWNEDRAVERYDALNEAETQTLSVSALDIDPNNEGQVVHFTANITNGGGTLFDDIFGVQTDGLVLLRNAEMYQWDEDVKTTTKTSTGGKKTTTKTYSYDKEWSSRVIDSSRFKKSGYNNPSSMEFTSAEWTANPIMIGARELPQDLVYKINWERSLDVSLDNITDESLRSRVQENDRDEFYIGSSPSSPQIGDQRVSFEEVPESVITIVGVQNGNSLTAFVSETGEGGDVLLFKQGNYSATAMYDAAEQENAVATWLIRFAGWAIMGLGLYLIFRPIEVFADIIPCVGSIVGCGLIFMAVTISAVLSSITIAIAWLVAHPEIGAIVLVVTLVVIGCCAFGVKKLTGKMKGGKGDDDSSSSSSSAGKADKLAPEAAIPTVAAVNEPTVYASALVSEAKPVPAVAYASAPPAAHSAPVQVYLTPDGGTTSGTAPSGPYVPN
ncbi:hypothetical protein ACHAXT_009271 [Thalassiosira profunda]